MPFLTASIDRAIVMTQYDLRGFAHPLGFRMDGPPNAKNLDAITGNFASFASLARSSADQRQGESPEFIDEYVSYFDSSFEEYLEMCKQLVSDCDGSAKEAIQFLIKQIVSRQRELVAEKESSGEDSGAYLKPLEKDNRWGKAVLALVEVFEVSLEEAEEKVPS